MRNNLFQSLFVPDGFGCKVNGLVIVSLAMLCSNFAIGQTSLYYSFQLTSTNWTSYSVPLTEGGWRVGGVNGPAATASQLQAVLSSLASLSLQFAGDYMSVGVDNISLASLATSTFDGCVTDGWRSPVGAGCACLVGAPAPSISIGLIPPLVLNAPGKFLGNKSAAYGGTLSLAAAPSQPTTCAVVLVSEPDPTQVGPFQALEWPSAVPPGLTNLIQVAAGVTHAVALKQDGTVAAWGSYSRGETNVPSGLSNVIAIAAGSYFSLALKSDGTVVGWGSSTFYGKNVPTGLSNVVAIASGGADRLALHSDGTVAYWSWYYSQSLVDPLPGLSNVVAIACQKQTFADGIVTNLVLLADGSVLGWTIQFNGTNAFPYFVPDLPPDLTNVTAIAGGGGHYLALTVDGAVIGWGNNAQGQASVPSGIGRVDAITAGLTFSAALRADGTVTAWGDDTYNQTFIPPGLSNVVEVSAGGEQTLSLIGTGPRVVQVASVEPNLGSDGFAVSVRTQCGKVYALEYKNSLADPTWTRLPLVAGTGKLLKLADSAATNATRFYRIRRW